MTWCEAPRKGGSREVADRNMVDVCEARVGRCQEVELAAPAESRHIHVARERMTVNKLLCSRVVIALALVVALAVASGAWWKWD